VRAYPTGRETPARPGPGSAVGSRVAPGGPNSNILVDAPKCRYEGADPSNVRETGKKAGVIDRQQVKDVHVAQ
jgi:hypothetical protein